MKNVRRYRYETPGKVYCPIDFNEYFHILCEEHIVKIFHINIPNDIEITIIKDSKDLVELGFVQFRFVSSTILYLELKRSKIPITLGVTEWLQSLGLDYDDTFYVKCVEV